MTEEESIARVVQLPTETKPADPEGAIDTALNQRKMLTSLGVLLVVTTILLSFGLTMLYSASFGIAGLFYFKRQLLWIGIGLAGSVTVFLLGYRWIAQRVGVWITLSIILLLAARCCRPINGAYRWLRVGAFSIQPSEFAKLAVALFVAKYCSEHLRSFSKFQKEGGLPHLALGVGVLCALILLGKDFGTTALVGSMAFCTMLAAGLYLRYLIVPLIVGALGGIYIYLFDPVRWARVTAFRHPEEYQSGIGYQLQNGLLALGSGDWFGIGFLASRMKAKYLPEAHTDFILAIVGEELGFVAIALVIVAYVIYGWSALRIAFRANSQLGTLLALALTFGVTIQAAINMAAVSASIPTKGMPAPFLSYGGSNLAACMMTTAMILSIGYEVVDPSFNERVLQRLRRFVPGRRKE